MLGDETLRTIARELVSTVRRNTTIDWAEKESVRARLRLIVKRVLRRYGYPPDKQEKATRTVLEQAELISASWGVEPPVEPEFVEETLDYARREAELGAIAEDRDEPFDRPGAKPRAP